MFFSHQEGTPTLRITATQTVCVKSHSPDIVTQEMLNAAGTLAAPFYMLFFWKAEQSTRTSIRKNTSCYCACPVMYY